MALSGPPSIRTDYASKSVPRTSKAASSITLDETTAFDRLLQYFFDNILKNRVALQFVGGNHERVGLLHRSDEI